MKREEIQKKALEVVDKSKYMILELITGYGKT